MCLPNESIYHYTSSVKTVENILTNGELWLSKSTVMNDFSEIKYRCDLFVQVVTEEHLEQTLSNGIIDNFLEAIRYKIFGDVFILSFSENENSILLWDSYSHKSGYNIEISNEFIRDFISRAPNEILVQKSGSNGLTKEIHGMKIQIVSQKDEFVISVFSHSSTANKALYDKEQQILIFKQALEILKKEYNNKNYIGVNICLSKKLDFIPFFNDHTLKEE